MAFMNKNVRAHIKIIQKHNAPPKEAATAIEPTTEPAAVAAAAKPVDPITGIIVPSVGANADKPAAIAGAASPENK